MNLYVRYFANEVIAHNIDEVVDFLNSLEGISYTDRDIDALLDFVEEEKDFLPYRLKVTYNNYVLFLKTEADTIAEFLEQAEQRKIAQERANESKRQALAFMQQEQEGWYEVSLSFKRVVQNPMTGKCQYVDTDFKARLIAHSIQDCYDRVIDYLWTRPDVDVRSQMPSIKSSKFNCFFIGDQLQEQPQQQDDNE